MQKFLAHFIRRLEQYLSRPAQVDGLWIGAGAGANEEKVRAALKLIAVYDPQRYSRILKDLKGIWVNIQLGNLGQYSPEDDVCELDEKFVRRAAPDEIASVIVHEATHARLWRVGIRYAEDIRVRVETTCLRQERVFASKLPNPKAVADDVDRRLDFISPDQWSDTAMERQQIRGLVAALVELKIPRWFIAFLVRRRRARRRSPALIAK